MSNEEIRLVQLTKEIESLKGQIQIFREELKKTKEKNKRLNENNQELQGKLNVKLQKITDKKAKRKK